MEKKIYSAPVAEVYHVMMESVMVRESTWEQLGRQTRAGFFDDEEDFGDNWGNTLTGWQADNSQTTLPHYSVWDE